MNWSSLILVNGPSSAGKTTLCRALQDAIEHPYLVVGLDDFIFMSTSRYYRGADTKEQSETDASTALGVEMVRASPPGAPISVTARFGPVFRRILDAMAPAVRTLIDHGNPVIFDHVLHDRAMYGKLPRRHSWFGCVHSRLNLPTRCTGDARTGSRRPCSWTSPRPGGSRT